MRILLTGANGYIGRRLLPVLLQQGHEVIACVRDKNALRLSKSEIEEVQVFEVDFLNHSSLEELPKNIDIAYFLMHSLSSGSKGFSDKEEKVAKNYTHYINGSTAKQTIYLSGISNDNALSDHLKSRQKTGDLLSESKVPVTTLRAAIIIGSGSASFEIIRDLVEKLPVMIAPKWLTTKCQPIGIRNVIEYLIQCINNPKVFAQTFDIGGPEVLTYKEMLLQFAKVRKMKRWIGTVPIMTPKLSSYWLYFVTSTSYHLAVNLVDSMKNEVVVKIGNIQDIIPINLLTYKENVSLAFKRIEQNTVVSSWTDAELLRKEYGLNYYIKVPKNGTFTDQKTVTFSPSEIDAVLSNIWAIGGERGWYYGNWMWKIRGYIDKLFGGVGLRRGRRSLTDVYSGDSVDFWRVILADKTEGRLLLFAEMRLPGEAWLEFRIESNDERVEMIQTATFRPKGLFGRIYWYSMLPFHHFIFDNMANNIVRFRPN
ncbi:MAG: hypothetical protein ACJAV5_000226 [Vicingaceae bacterium]|jgi:uncharacterized protein YbjT (DUF2867 family)